MNFILTIAVVIAVFFYFINPNIINHDELNKTTSATTQVIKDDYREIKDRQNGNDYGNMFNKYRNEIDRYQDNY